MKQKFSGYGITTGIGIGYAHFENKDSKKILVSKKTIYNSKLEIEKFKNALNKSIEEIDNLIMKAELDYGKDKAKIFETHKLILLNENLNKRVLSDIKNEKINAEWSIENLKIEYLKKFEEIENKVLRERSKDVEDVLDRLIRNLMDIKSNVLTWNELEEKTVLIVKDMTPSEVMHLNNKNIIGIIMEDGSMTSHASIIIKTLGIPIIIGTESISDKINLNDLIIVDGDKGNVIVNPDKNDMNQYEAILEKTLEAQDVYNKFLNKSTFSKDGYKFEIMGNIATMEDARKSFENSAEGIGIVRTEFMYMDRDSLPGLEEQIENYEGICEGFEGRTVIIRTLDIGGDKNVSYLPIDKEKNPALGHRGIRYCLEEKALFKEQIKAIYMINKKYNVKIMYPMVTTIEELDDIEKIEKEVQFELESEGIPYRKIEKGIMIETPAAAIQSYDFAQKVDFFSIGTNDLIQYVIAADRENIKIKNLYNYYNPAVLRLIKYVIDNAKKANISVSMCGEMGNVPEMVPLLLAMGLDSLSVNPNNILKTRYIVSKSSKKNMVEEVDKVLEINKSEDVKQYIKDLYNSEVQI